MRVVVFAAGLAAVVACATGAIERAEPPRDLLQATRAAELGGRWSNLTEYCIDAGGLTNQIRTVYPSGDPWLDEIYRETVSKWRFSAPARPRCVKQEFHEDFGPARILPDGVCGAPVTGPSKRLTFDVIKMRAIRQDMPSGELLAALVGATGLVGWTIVNRTSFRVEKDGSVGEVSTLRSSGHANIDALLRATVAQWRFTPLVVGGRPLVACTDFEFAINFTAK